MSKQRLIREFKPPVSDVAICGSMRHVHLWSKVIDELRARGLTVTTPHMEEKTDWDKLTDEEVAERKGYLMRRHFANIARAKTILVCNYEKDGAEHYIGPNTLIEIAVGFAYGVPVHILNDLPVLPGRQELLGFKPTILRGDLKLLLEKIGTTA